jgi:preprotein translocase subunit Sec63
LTKEGIETETAARYFKAIKESTHEEDVINMLAASSEYEMVNIQISLLSIDVQL